MNSSDNGQWLTYDEIAEARGTEKIGAIRWVQRHKWRRQPGNDGLVRVLVPPEALVRTALRGQQSRTVTPLPDDSVAVAFEAALAAIREAHTGELAAIRKAHDSDLTALREQLLMAKARHGEELAALHEQLCTIRAGHTEEQAALQDKLHIATERAEGFAADLTALREQLSTADARYAEELAALQDQLHTAATRAETLASDHAVLGEQLRTAQEQTKQVNTVLARFEADLGAKEAEAAGQRVVAEQARDAARKAEEAAEALRQAEAERKGRGRLRRAWDGWRGR